MPYDQDKIFNQALKLIEEKSVFFITDLVALLPIHRDTFYRFFPIDSDRYDRINTALEAKKVEEKLYIRAQLRKSPKAAELIALYKLICTDEERRALSMNHLDVTSQGKEVQSQIIVNLGSGIAPQDEATN